MFNLKSSTYLKLIFTVSLISIIIAYFIEYALGYQPCNLCLIERIPYMLSIILISLIFIFKKNEKFLILLLILIFSFSFLISIYHLGIELDFIEESSVCGLKNTAETISKEELLKQLNEINISCKDVTFKIFGLSLTSINVILSLIITIITIKLYILNEKNKL
jgi:disulfide bond formation protein DsbB